MNTYQPEQNKCKHGVPHSNGHQSCDGCCTMPLSTTQQEQDALFDELQLGRFENGLQVPSRREDYHAYLHSRDLAIEEAVRAELVEKIEQLREAYMDSDYETGHDVALSKVLALLTTSPSR